MSICRLATILPRYNVRIEEEKENERERKGERARDIQHTYTHVLFVATAQML